MPSTNLSTYVHKAQAINALKPGSFNSIQLFILEAAWDHWTWAELAQALKAKLGRKVTKEQARDMAKQVVKYLSSLIKKK